jgi:hypothetical protein
MNTVQEEIGDGEEEWSLVFGLFSYSSVFFLVLALP